ncbi:anaphase promoting complex subunit 10, partial [Thalassiosira pseudonana CCMP1335]
TVREIGKSAQWSLSTAKPGNGVDQLRDSSLDTYWQSDGLQPHYINIQFPRRQTVSAIALYMDFNLDESYTPKKMKVRVGTTFHNLEEVRVVDVKEPIGWVTIPLWRKHVPVWKRKPMRTHFVQLGITSMHQNGRDTHIRQVKIFGPRDDGSSG